MTIDPASSSPAGVYRLMVQAIIPRPIAFVSTLGADGILNLGPFSFFTAISADSPVNCFWPMIRGRDCLRKDTLRNIELTREFVVNIVWEEFGRQMNVCSTEFPPEVDEFEASGLTSIPSELVKPPRVGESHVHMECKLVTVVDVSATPARKRSGSILPPFKTASSTWKRTTSPKTILQPSGRMDGPTYARTTDRFDLERPKLPLTKK